jgi:signal transduction histidine kinase
MNQPSTGPPALPWGTGPYRIKRYGTTLATCDSEPVQAPWHVLLIQDNAQECADLRQMLLRGGARRYRFSEARLGADGVRQVLTQEHGPVDCVLLDYGLPDMEALEVLAALRQGNDMTACPVVVITGAAIEEGQSLLSAGAQDFIGKRWTSPESLTRSVENAVDRYALQAEHLRADEALRTSEERYRALFNSIDTGYAVVEVMFDKADAAVNARYLQVNPAFARHTGLVDVEGQTLRGLVPDIEDFWLDTYGTVALSGVPTRLERYVPAMHRWFDIYAFRLGAPQARQVAVLFSDTTERKTNEAALMTARATADTANRAKSDFLLNMSHELRSPLSAILGFAQLIEGGQPPPTPAQQDSVQQILSAGWYLLGLINEILDLSSIESGKTVLKSRVMSMAEVLDDCQAMIGPQAQKSGIRIAFQALQEPCLVLADPVRTKQVLINLLTNAIKYNRVAGLVQVRCAAAPGQRVRVSVEDTGQGLSKAQLDQLFEPFNRLGQELGAEPGTGIGLVICRRLVEQMGGCMGADSTPGVGSCFWFELEAAAEPLLASTDLPVRAVLCIEEDLACLQQVEAVVALCPGICLLRARDVSSGLVIARTARPDVILMGSHLLGPGGMDLCVLLARDPATAQIPLIALNADGAGRDANVAAPAGFVACLSQPLERTALIDALDLAFQPQQAGGLLAPA